MKPSMHLALILVIAIVVSFVMIGHDIALIQLDWKMLIALVVFGLVKLAKENKKALSIGKAKKQYVRQFGLSHHVKASRYRGALFIT